MHEFQFGVYDQVATPIDLGQRCDRGNLRKYRNVLRSSYQRAKVHGSAKCHEIAGA